MPARFGKGVSFLVVTAALPLVACTPTAYRLEPYRRDPALAEQLERHADDLCRERRGSTNLPPHHFTTDGCSGWPDSTWVRCCIEHDIAYWCGGSCKDREHADEVLRECVAANGGPWGMGTMMYLGTRLGGPPWYPFSFRWAYGWDWPHGYDDLPVHGTGDALKTDGVTAGPSCHRR